MEDDSQSEFSFKFLKPEPEAAPVEPAGFLIRTGQMKIYKSDVRKYLFDVFKGVAGSDNLIHADLGCQRVVLVKYKRIEILQRR